MFKMDFFQKLLIMKTVCSLSLRNMDPRASTETRSEHSSKSRFTLQQFVDRKYITITTPYPQRRSMKVCRRVKIHLLYWYIVYK